MSVEIDGLERALDALLTAMTDAEAKRAPGHLTASSIRFADLNGPIPTRAEMEVTQLLREPVYSALRIGIRRLGAETFKVTGGTDGMREVAERVADRVPGQYGRRLATMDSAWDGVGSDSDRWWA